jgi:hypothetical protein
MLRLFPVISLLVFMCLLSGCHVLPSKQYSYVPPHSAADRSCVSKCMQAIKYCQRICTLKNKSARSCSCVTSFNTCYMACGGQVVER